ncbi:MAG: hypothetical protein M1814_001229 [Vezdaea aestivalis]|nr:MAG: hypothetical protein M1814_001229 [Vezdaea aestivalis]
MQFFYLLLQFLSLLAFGLAVNTESYTVLQTAAARRGITMQAGTIYMFRELWAPRGDATDCISGYAHVRLIVGSPAGLAGNMDFRAEAYDLGVTELTNGGVVGSPTYVERAEWRANQRPQGNGWVRVSKDNVYEYVGVTTTVADVIENLGEQYPRDHPKYAMRTANCRTFVDWLVGKIAQGATWKRAIGDRSKRQDKSTILERALQTFPGRMQFKQF